MNPVFLRTALALLLATAPAVAARAQTTTAAPAQTQVVCASKPGERQTCAAETGAGVTLVSVLGSATCERGRTWDYDAAGLWVADGCTAVFSVPKTEPPDRYGPEGFRLADSGMGSVNFKLLSYLRYLNQQGLDSTYTDSFGTVKPIDRRQDTHLQKVNVQFLGLDCQPEAPLSRLHLDHQHQPGPGRPGGGRRLLQYRFNEHVTVGGGIGPLPGTRTLEGNFPFWLPLDNRLIAEEF